MELSLRHLSRGTSQGELESTVTAKGEVPLVPLQGKPSGNPGGQGELVSSPGAGITEQILDRGLGDESQ